MKQNTIFAEVLYTNNQMLERTIIKELRKWTDNPYRKPLILCGARQVGKTTIVGQFSKDLTDVWRGMAAEQIVAQELKALTNEVGSKR